MTTNQNMNTLKQAFNEIFDAAYEYAPDGDDELYQEYTGRIENAKKQFDKAFNALSHTTT